MLGLLGEFNSVQGRREQLKQCPRQAPSYDSSILTELNFRRIMKEENALCGPTIQSVKQSDMVKLEHTTPSLITTKS